MTSLRKAVIESIGHGLPARIMTNNDLAKIVDTNDEWIAQRTGIRERRIASLTESCSTLSMLAATEAMEGSTLEPEDLQLVVCATVSGDYIWPSTACVVQNELGAINAGAFDVSAACAGFIYALSVASAMVENGTVDNALVIGVDTLSKQVDWTDRSTCVLFGDAAGAVILRAEENSERGVVKTVLLSDGSGSRHIRIDVGGTKYPFGTELANGLKDTITMNGAEVYRFAVNAMGDACEKVLKETGLTVDDIDLFVPHQANLRIIDSAAAKLKLSPDKIFINVQKYGNTSGGSIPLALYEAEKEGKLKKGMLVMTVGFGAGLVWGANIIRW